MKIKVSNTNAQTGNKHAVRVYIDGERIAEVNPPKRNPLGYLRKHEGSKYWVALREQIHAKGYPHDETALILDVVRGEYD